MILTRASWLSIVVGLSIYLCLAFRNALLAHRTRVLAVCLSMILVTVVVLNLYVPQTASGKFASFKQSEPGAVVKRTVSAVQFREGRGVATRFYVWKKALHMIMERPWFGYGLETFQLAFQPYNREYTERFNDYTTVDRIHNNYLDTAFTMGRAGLAFYLAVIISFMSLLRGLICRGHNTSRRLWYVGIFSGFCGYLLNDLFIFSVVSVSPTFWSLMGLTIAAGKLDRAEEMLLKITHAYFIYHTLFSSL